jgi:Family of unknown function (DUF6152)
MHPSTRTGRARHIRVGAAVIAALTLGAAGAALAHHGVDGEFDRGKPVTVTGMISHVDWINPHIYFTLYVKDASGKFIKWQCETIPTAFAHKAGFNAKKLMDGGLSVAVSGYRARTDPHFMWAHKLVYGDGHSVSFGDF